MKTFIAVLCLACTASAAKIELVAGGGTKDGDAPATECRLREPFGVEFASDGAMIVVEMERGNRVLRVDKSGKLTVIAGTGVKGFAGDDGDAKSAQFNGVHNLAIGKEGDILLADSWNYRIRKLNGKGVVTTIAGTGKKGFGGDGGTSLDAQFSTIIQIALSPDKTRLYLTDIENRRIRRIALDSGTVETVAGNGERGVPADGADAKASPLADPRAVTVAADGSFYILERGGHALRFVRADGKIRTVAGTGKAGNEDGPGLQASFNGPKHPVSYTHLTLPTILRV